MMDLEIKKIKEDDIRGLDIQTDYVAYFAFMVVAVAGVFLYQKYKNSSHSLPLSSKNRLD